jgi:hypothetical protein
MLLECTNCEAVVDATEIASHGYAFQVGDDLSIDACVWLVKCPRCDRPMLAYQDEADEQPQRIFPPMDRNLHHSVPEAIRVAFTEARACFRARAFTAASIMCRKTLEGICSEHGVGSSGTLATRLEKLKEDGVIENRLFDWAEELRMAGNEAAHGVKFVVLREDARNTLEFTEALIEYVFTYRHKFDQFKRRRANAASSNQEKPEDDF